MDNEFGTYLIPLRGSETDEKALLEFFKKVIDSPNNKNSSGELGFKSHIKGTIFDMLSILKNDKKEVFDNLVKEIKKRDLDILIDPHTNNLYDSIKRTKDKNGEYPLLPKLIKSKLLQDRIKKDFDELSKGGRNKAIKFSLMLDNHFLYSFLRFQKEQDITDKYVIPYNPIDPTTFRVSLIKNEEMILNGKIYLMRILSIKDPKIVPVICVTKNMLKFIYGKLDKDGRKIVRRIEWSKVLESYKHIGIDFKTLIIKIDNFSQYERDTSYFEAIRYFFVEVKKLFPEANIIFSDFNEFSYKLTLDGLDSYGTSISNDLSRSRGGGKPITAEQRLGKYYVEKDMEYCLINQIGDKLDSCFFCKMLKNKKLNESMNKKLWQYCRLGHFINAKNNEANKINKADKKGQLKAGIQDMFAESKNLKSLA